MFRSKDKFSSKNEPFGQERLNKTGNRDILSQSTFFLPNDLASCSANSYIFGCKYLQKYIFHYGRYQSIIQYRSNLNVKADFRCAFSTIKQRIQALVAKNKCQLSYWLTIVFSQNVLCI